METSKKFSGFFYCFRSDSAVFLSKKQSDSRLIIRLASAAFCLLSTQSATGMATGITIAANGRLAKLPRSFKLACVSWRLDSPSVHRLNKGLHATLISCAQFLAGLRPIIAKNRPPLIRSRELER